MADPLRPRDGGEQATTALELFFDLVYVFAVTQLSHLLIGSLTWAGAGRTAFLLVVVWWAWIYTTWMVNWFDPEHPRVRVVLLGAMLVSLLMAAALPGALKDHGLLFAGAYVVLQVGRNGAAAAIVDRTHALSRTIDRLLAWSLLSAGPWLGGAFLHGDHRLWLWGPALVIDLVAPLAGYRIPGRGRSLTGDWTIEGAHFADRFQGFIIIALGESIVVSGATAQGAGLGSTTVISLAVAFLGTGALWWLYFGEVAEHSRAEIAASEDPGALARDAYTYLHLPIVAGIIAVAVGDDLVILHPHHALALAGALAVLGGPALYLAGESLFRLRMIGSVSLRRIGTIVCLGLLGALASHISALFLETLATATLAALAVWEYRVGV